jgi:hypothetical protein
MAWSMQFVTKMEGRRRGRGRARRRGWMDNKPVKL